MPLLTLLTNLGIVAVIWFGGLSVELGRMSLGELVAFNNYVMIGMAPLMLLGNTLTMVARAEASAERIFGTLDTQPAVKVNTTPHRSDTLAGSVVFDHVSFRYDLNDAQATGEVEPEHRGGRKVLDAVSFGVQPGQRIALLGATGSGKSTLVNLIPRFYDVDDGRILIDGVDLREWEPDELRKRIGVVLQQTTLFSGTIRENIAYGRPDVPLEEVISASKVAQAHDFIMAMPDGYDSLVEERGANLSGGQKQRIAIARALLISPSILIFDDSTSAVDMVTEAKIHADLEESMTGTTVFVIAQRISSVLNAGKILVLDHGRIVAQGDHRSLLSNSPIYQEIYQSQMGNGRGLSHE
jgi:ATP-binding cassette subfamily B protein